MCLEQIDPPHIPAQRVDGSMPADLHHLPNVRARLGSTGQEPRSQAVPENVAGSWPARCTSFLMRRLIA
jgi:hypothetical protein